MSLEFFIVFLCSILSLVLWRVYNKQILEAPQGTDRMKEIASAIQEGAQAYLNRQYVTIAAVGILITLLLFYLIENVFVSIGFSVAQFCSEWQDTLECLFQFVQMFELLKQQQRV